VDSGRDAEGWCMQHCFWFLWSMSTRGKRKPNGTSGGAGVVVERGVEKAHRQGEWMDESVSILQSAIIFRHR